MNINIYNSYIREELELYHHGIMGQRWGKRNGPPYPLGTSDHSASEKKAGWRKSLDDNDPVGKAKASGHYVVNTDKFGTNRDDNVLFITGLSGSGKSTIAESFKKDNRIHLDFYTEKGSREENERYQDKEFNQYLRNKGIEFEKIPYLTPHSKEKWKLLDDVGDAIVDFSRYQYDKGKRVVVEGVQLADQTMYPEKNFFKDKPLIVLNTSSMKSLHQGLKRDGISPFDVVCVAQRMKHQKIWKKQIKDLKRINN